MKAAKLLVLLIWTVVWWAQGVHIGVKEATYKMTIACVEKPNVCKDRYQYLKLGEKLRGAND
jgi:hypothetical protein